MPRFLILFLSIVGLLVATLIPGNGATGVPYLDKVAHFALFFFAGWNLMHCYSRSSYILLYLFALSTLAPLTEVAQIYIPLRGFEWLDIIADLAGICFAYLCYKPHLAKLYSIVVK